MSLALVGFLLAAQDPAPILLRREYVPHQKFAYAVRSSLHSERRDKHLVTWMPSDLDINYDFSLVVEALKSDGIAIVRYRRPSTTEIEGETFDSPEKTTVSRSDVDLRLTISPFNEVLEMKNLRPKATSLGGRANWLAYHSSHRPRSFLRSQDADFATQFVGELERLSLFVGNLDSTLDLAPRTPFRALKIGDAWKQTVGYQPQRIKGKDEQAVQRLDYTYTFRGLVDGEKGKVLRVEAKLDFSNDLADFIRQLTAADSDQLGLQRFPLGLKATILFDLDPKSKITLRADAASEASFEVFVPNRDDPVYEQRMKGHTTLSLVGRATLRANLER